MTRVGFILAAILSLTPTWTAAQESWVAFADGAPQDNIGGIHNEDLIVITPGPSNRSSQSETDSAKDESSGGQIPQQSGEVNAITKKPGHSIANHQVTPLPSFSDVQSGNDLRPKATRKGQVVKNKFASQYDSSSARPGAIVGLDPQPSAEIPSISKKPGHAIKNHHFDRQASQSASAKSRTESVATEFVANKFFRADSTVFTTNDKQTAPLYSRISHRISDPPVDFPDRPELPYVSPKNLQVENRLPAITEFAPTQNSYFPVVETGELNAQLPGVKAELQEKLPEAPEARLLLSNVNYPSAESLGTCQHCVDNSPCDTCSFDYLVDQINCGNTSVWRHCCQGNNGHCRKTGDRGCWVCDRCGHDVQGLPGCGPETAFRFGWWAVQFDGSPVKVGEYQGLTSSPFADLDGIWTNRERTLDYTISVLDNETTDARAYYYGGRNFAIKFNYERFLHRLDHEPLAAFDLDSGPPAADDKVVGEDLNVGEDYAIRVQQLETRFQGRLTNNLKWKVDLWGMRKSGERQANAMAHCFDVDTGPGVQNLTCHVLSQRQSIDWTAMEIKPALEAKVGNAVVEYSRTMRAFGQNDQIVDRTYTAFEFSPVFGEGGADFNYAWVPENFTQVDRLKLNMPLDEANQLYAHLYFGNTENKFRDTHRDFNGYDIRLINRAIDGVTLTGYAKIDTQKNELPTTFLTAPPFGVDSGNADQFEPGSLRHPVDYDNTRFGLKGRWQSQSRKWLSIVGGYEFVKLARDFADYNTLSGPFTQEDTQTNQIKFGPQLKVSPALSTFLRYRGRFIDNPLIGVRPADGQFNTNRPEQVHGVEIGGTWTPTRKLMATALFGIENSWHNSEFADFDEDNYPIVLTLWYAPTSRWSLTGGYGFFSNWIDQDITIGFRDNPTERTEWNYDGYNHLFSISSNFAWTPRTQLVGGVELNWGNNVFTVPTSTAGADWTLLPTFSEVDVDTMRINLGIDREFRPDVSAYFRFVYFDYEDVSASFNSGTTDMYLAGISVLR